MNQTSDRKDDVLEETRAFWQARSFRKLSREDARAREIIENLTAYFGIPSEWSWRAQERPGTSKTIGSIIRGFKIGVTQWMRQQSPIHDVWQRNYYEHIIRDEAALNRIRGYIVENPARWAEDSENPARNLTPIATRRGMS